MVEISKIQYNLTFLEKKMRLCFLGVFLVACLNTQVQAQSIEEIYKDYFDNWYQIELIIFERIQRNSSDTEAWPKNITLDYPRNLRFLQGEEPLEKRSADDETIRQRNSELLDKLKQKSAIDTPEDPLNSKIIDSIRKLETERLTPKEEPFKKLDENLRTLNEEVTKLVENGSMRLLFHEIWRQPILSRDKAFTIPINGGDVFDDHYELEGSISVHVARYLHVTTNLWLSWFEANFGQESEHWPILPPRPEPPEFEIGPTLEQSLSVEENSGLTLETSAIDTQAIGRWHSKESNLGNNEGLNLNNVGFDSQDMLSDYSSLAQKPYLIKQIVKMTQKRRMRSGELHYLDHPRIGMIVKMDRYNPTPPSAVPVSQ